MRVFILISILTLTILFGVKIFLFNNSSKNLAQSSPTTNPNPTTSPKIKLKDPDVKKTLNNDYHIFETFNNCGPASLSMALSYFNIQKSQKELGDKLRPYKIQNGNNDDKSVTLDEMAKEAENYGLIAYHRPNGDINLIKKFISYDIPVIVRTWIKENEDIGHYRVVKGYDDERQIIIQDDSLQGKNLEFKYELFNKIWEKFNYEYLVIVPKDKKEIAEKILGENKNLKTSWQIAAKNSQNALIKDPENIYTRFNLSIALFNTDDYQGSVNEFEKVEEKLPFRTLWYQIEPIKAYYNLGNYDRVFSLTQQIFNNQNKAYSEAYLLRGYSYLKLNDKENAKKEFENAYKYNQNLEEAKTALNSI